LELASVQYSRTYTARNRWANNAMADVIPLKERRRQVSQSNGPIIKKIG
jgi:hypothetical protein